MIYKFIKQFLVIILSLFYNVYVNADSVVYNNLPLELTKLEWYCAEGFDIQYTQISNVDKNFYKIEKFPILPNSIYKTPNSFSKVYEYTLFSTFSLDLSKLALGKEIAFLFSGIGESWSIYLNGVNIKDEFGVSNGKIEKFRVKRNTIISIPHNVLSSNNTIVIRLAGHASATPIANNLFLGLRFKEGYILDYEKNIRENTKQTSLLLFNAIYIFFGFYHLFFFIRWTEKKYNLYFAFFSLSISTYFLSFSNIAFESFSDTRILIFFAYISQPLSLLFFILFLYDYFYPHKKFSYFIQYVIGSNILIIFSFIVLKIPLFLTILYVWYAFAAPQIFYILLFITIANKKHLKDSLLMASSISIILLVVIWEMLDTIFFHTGFRFLQFAYFGFIVSMIIILANRFIEINWETGRLNKELLKQRDSFSKFVPIQFLELLDKASAADILPGDCKLKEMTVLFSDIRSFTTLSESMTPEENFNFINSYLRRMNPIIQSNKGFIDKFIGDAIMAIFPTPNHALNASIQMIQELELYNQHRNNSGYPPIKIGIGINTGHLMMGTVGNEERMSTTVIGDSVNLASRLESLTKDYNSSILLSEYAANKLEDRSSYTLKEIGITVVRGKTQSLKIYTCEV